MVGKFWLKLGKLPGHLVIDFKCYTAGRAGGGGGGGGSGGGKALKPCARCHTYNQGPPSCLFLQPL